MSQRHKELVETLCRLQLSKLTLFQNSSTEMLRLRTMTQYLCKIQEKKKISAELLEEINTFNIVQNNNAKIDNATSIALKLYHEEQSLKLSIAELEKEIERLTKSKIESINTVYKEINDMRNIIRSLVKKISATYKDIQYLFESDIGCIIVEYCSCETLVAICKSGILNKNNDKHWKDIIDYNMRFNAFIAKNEVQSRVQSFISKTNLKEQCKGAFYGISYYAIHVWDVNITNMSSSNDEKMCDSIFRNLQTPHRSNANLNQANNDVLSKVNKVKKIIRQQIKQFNAFTRPKEQKKLYVMYYLSFFYQIPTSWAQMSNNFDELQQMERKIFGRTSNQSSHVNRNGATVEISTDFQDVKQFWVELFVRIYLKYKSLQKMNKIKTKQPIFGIYNQYYAPYHTEFHLSEIGDICIENNDTQLDVLKRYHATVNNCYQKVTSDEQVIGMISDVLIPGFVDFDGVYVCNSYKVVCLGQPCWEYHGEKWLLAKMKTPNTNKYNERLVFWSWRIAYDDLG